MSLIGGITDFLTGGANQQSEQALNDALKTISDVHAPTQEELTLPQLEKYIQMGLMTPQQAEAVLQQQNAYDDINLDPRAREASIDALMKMQDIGMSGGHDAQHEAATYDALSKSNQQTQAQRASIMDQMAQRGIPLSLMGVSSQLAAAGQDAEQSHKDMLQANADAESRALAALQSSGQLGSQISGQQFNESSTKAAAQNAIDQWNAANQTQVNQGNAANRQQAELYNKQNEQAVSNANVQNDNARTQYNTGLPQDIYNNAMQKANALAGVYGQQSKNYSHIGEQNAGTSAAILNGIQQGASAFAGAPPVPGGATAGGATSAMGSVAPEAMMLASEGGRVPGHAPMPGNHPANDQVPALLSPDEVVLPRTVSHDPNQAANFIRHLNRNGGTRPVHHEDIKAVLEALTQRRNGGQ